jgi:hypothetical protein
MTGTRISRRTWLRGTAGAALGLPLLEAMGARSAVAAPPRRIVFFHSVLGTYLERFFPRLPGAAAFPAGYRPREHYMTGDGPLDATDFQLAPITTPLEKHKKDLLFVEGLNIGAESGHAAMRTVLTGVRPGEASTGFGISVDQVIANQIGKETKFPSLQLGVRCSGLGKYQCISWYGPGKGAAAQSNPRAVFDRVFAEVPARGAGGAPADGAFETLRAERRSVIDAAVWQVAALQKKLGAADRAKLDAFLDSVRQVEGRLAKTANVVAGCARPATPAVTAGGDSIPTEATPMVAQTQVDLLAMALACDLTRVATFQIGFEGYGATYPWINANTPHHGLSHCDPGDPNAIAAYDEITRIQIWNAQLLAGLVDRLKAIPEGSGTVMDSTVIVWTNSLSMGEDHTGCHMPVLLVGSAGGFFKTGRHVRYDRRRGVRAHAFNDLHVILLRSMGLTANTFGDAAFNWRPLEELRG